MRRLALLISLAVATSCGPCFRPRYDPPECGVENTSAQALYVAPPPVLIVRIDSSLTCTPGVAEDCDEKLATCTIDAGEVAIGDVARTLVTLHGAFVTVDVATDCADIYLERVPLVAVGETDAFNVVVRPSAVGACEGALQMRGAGNLPDDLFEVPISATRVAGDVEPGCRADDACCCGTNVDGTVFRASPECIDERVTCVSGDIAFDQRCDLCPGTAPVAQASAQLVVDDVTPATGATAGLRIDTFNASACDAFIDGRRDDALSLERTGDIAVDQPTTVTVSCIPEGPASTAALRLAPACIGEQRFSALTFDGDEVRDDAGAAVALDDEACIVVDGELTVIDASPAIAARVTQVGALHFISPGHDGLDFPALEDAALSFDYDNGIAPPDGVGLDVYLAFPSLRTTSAPIELVRGRVDLRALTGGSILVDGRGAFPGPSVIDFREGATLDELVWENTGGTSAPVITGSVRATSLIIRNNPQLGSSEIDKMIAKFADGDTVVIICGNLEDAPCE